MNTTKVILSFLSVALMITPLWADDISPTECLTLVSGTWINNEYRDRGKWGKFVLQSNGRFADYLEVSDTEPVSRGDIKINEVWTDTDGNIWFKSNVYSGGYYRGADISIYELNRINESNSIWETVLSYHEYPTVIDPDSLFYRIYYRQE